MATTEKRATDPTSPWDDLLFGVRRSVRYHMRRQRFFERWHLVTSAIAVIFGSATVTMLLTDLGRWWIAGAAVIITVFSAVDLVVGTSKAARLHNDLARRFISLEKEITTVADATDEDVRRFTSGRLEIEADEPPILRVLDALCHNELMRAMGYPEAKMAQVGPLQRALAQFLDWGAHRIQPRETLPT